MYREISPEELKVDKTLGYVYFLDNKHPLGSKAVGRVYYHRHIASLTIGRWLSVDEAVHHIDGNKQNNDSCNLQVMSFKDHAKLHRIEDGFVPDVLITCPICNKGFLVAYRSVSKRVHCSEACAKKAQIKWSISKEDLEVLIWNIPYTKIAKIYPISDVGAKKRAVSLGCLVPPPYFFNKSEEYRKEQRKLHNIPDLPT